ncbi:hypothetical protein [Agrococcus sp. Marseille-P2731]|uniref:hypothetical protein n=1 Tax=Agrococcus sp. Marseille-P2731 TaxID=1841862 RepID=UPI00093149EC|nr:hypothetical protein [Agrococcus sp. Marseille-P2731]
MSAQYQVTLEWAAAGLRAAAADVVVLADADRGPETEELLRLAPRTALVLEATLVNADRIARAALDEQERRGERASIAIVAAGERWPDGSLRPTAADLLVAGRVVDELAELGIDFHSPACAAACAAAVGLRGATNALVAAEARGAGAASAPGSTPGPAHVTHHVPEHTPEHTPEHQGAAR